MQIDWRAAKKAAEEEMEAVLEDLRSHARGWHIHQLSLDRSGPEGELAVGLKKRKVESPASEAPDKEVRRARAQIKTILTRLEGLTSQRIAPFDYPLPRQLTAQVKITIYLGRMIPDPVRKP